MLIARPRRMFSRDYLVSRDDGERVADLDITLLKEGGVLRYDGKTYRIEREGFMQGPWQLKDGAEVVFEAQKPSLVRNRFITVVKNASLELAAQGWALQEFKLVGPDWAQLGRVRRPSLFSRRMDVELSELVPELAQLFFLFQAMVIWQRADAAVSTP